MYTMYTSFCSINVGSKIRNDITHVFNNVYTRQDKRGIHTATK